MADYSAHHRMENDGVMGEEGRIRRRYRPLLRQRFEVNRGRDTLFSYVIRQEDCDDN